MLHQSISITSSLAFKNASKRLEQIFEYKNIWNCSWGLIAEIWLKNFCASFSVSCNNWLEWSLLVCDTAQLSWRESTIKSSSDERLVIVYSFAFHDNSSLRDKHIFFSKMTKKTGTANSAITNMKTLRGLQRMRLNLKKEKNKYNFFKKQNFLRIDK